MHWDGRRWSQVGTPNPGFTTLVAVSCPLPASCWAAGIPSPGGTVPVESYSELKGVRCTSPGDCWAVGDCTTRDGDLPFLTRALHSNGTRWTIG